MPIVASLRRVPAIVRYWYMITPWGESPHLERIGTAAAQPGHVGVLDHKGLLVAVVVACSTRAQRKVIPEYGEQIVGVHGTRDIGVSPHTEAAFQRSDTRWNHIAICDLFCP